MNRFLAGVARATAETFDLPGPILEVGSYQVRGQESVAELRSLFLGKEYLGIDMRAGPGVDRVADVEALPFADASFGTVIAMSTFEHVPHFWKGFDEVFRVLRPGGALLVSTPFYFHIHSYPSDYWRFSPFAFELLLRAYPSKIIGWHGPSERPANVWAIAFREGRPAITTQELHAYQDRLRQQAREPLDLKRRVLFQTARLFCGRRPFAPHLDREKWQVELHNPPALGDRAA